MSTLSILAKAMGSKGGKNRAKILSKERMREIAAKGGRCRAEKAAKAVAEKKMLDAKLD